ncbi:MAG: hypothetical protein ACK2VA_11480 [Anaerolineae bacterium]
MDCKFPEPRGWALRWEGTALFPTPDCESQQDDALDAPAPTLAWAPLWQQVTAATMPVSRNGHGRNGLTRPRGWALQWEGSALIDRANGHELEHLRAVEPEKEGAA